MKFKNKSIIFLCLFISTISILGTFFDSNLYKEPIIKITNIKNLSKTTTTDTYQNKDHEYIQKVTGVYLNTSKKGSSVIFQNTYTDSQAIDYHYFVGQQVFINPKLNELSQPKRDLILIVLINLTLLLLIFFMKSRGLKTIISIILNISVLYLALRINEFFNGLYLFLIISILTIILTATTLFIILGWNKQFIISLTSTIFSIFLALGISFIILNFTHDQGIHYETIDYAIQPFKTVFLAEVLLGLLGAVMDETTDITSSLHELKIQHPSITKLQLFKSGMNIGQELVGPLINVLFFIFMAGVFPIFILFLRDNNTVGYTISRTLTLGFTQSIISSIGITLAVPITSFFSTFLAEVKTK